MQTLDEGSVLFDQLIRFIVERLKNTQDAVGSWIEETSREKNAMGIFLMMSEIFIFKFCQFLKLMNPSKIRN